MKTFKQNTVLFLGLAWSFWGFSQTSLPQLTITDYPKWGTLEQELLSPDGLWVSYAMLYDNAVDTTFVRNIKTGQTFNFPQASKAIFAADSKQFAIQVSGKGVALLDLKAAAIVWIEKAIHHEFMGHCLITSQKSTSGNDLVIQFNKQILQRIPNVTSFKQSSNDRLAVVGTDFVSIFDGRKNWKKTIVLNDSLSNFFMPTWNEAGTRLAFIKKRTTAGPNIKNSSVCLYDASTMQLKTLDNTGLKQFGDYEIISSSASPLLLDNISPLLFFYLKEPAPNKNPSLVEIWDTATPLEYPLQKVYGHAGQLPKLVAWNPDTNKIIILGTNQRPKVDLTTDKKYAISHNPFLPTQKHKGNQLVDYYITNIATGHQKLFLSKQSTALSTMTSSPDGRYISYLRNEGWYVYDNLNGKHIRLITADSTFKSSGWSSDSQKLILNDNHDLWLLDLNGTQKQRITNGREKNIRFELYEQLYREQGPLHPTDFRSRTINLTQGIVLQAMDENMKSGYFIWSKKKGLNLLAFRDSKINRLQKAADGTTYIFVEQSAAVPPKLIHLSPQSNRSGTIFQSNNHFLHYAPNRVELVPYSNLNGTKLSGLLFYPTNYKQGKHYPMIVKVYEKQSTTLHTYYNPSMFNNSGFVPTNYTNDGYFVLLPDIEYEIGNPGKSAVACIETSVKAVIEKDMVDKNRIGLIGHSFGGYEVAFTITQSGMFAAAVSGAAVTDLIGSYLSLSVSSGSIRFDRFETQQYRLGSSPFTAMQNYLENSPVIHAAKITTPLLSWTGLKDKNVDWKQGVGLHLALRRLKKENQLLVYPDEGHVLQNPEAQLDLSIRISDWFKNYLKK